jgi:prevent-host-death family protein
LTERIIKASTFKERCLALLDQVARTGVPIIVTKRGRPVAKVVPVDDRQQAPIVGSVRILEDDEELLFSTDERWNVEG